MSNVTPAEAARVYQELMTADLGPIPAWYQMLDVNEWSAWYLAVIKNDRAVMAELEQTGRDRVRERVRGLS